MRPLQIDKVVTVRGGNTHPIKMANGDLLDSVMMLYSGPTLIYSTDKVNTDPSLAWKMKGGIMAECTCRAIFDRRQDNKNLAFYFFNSTPERAMEIVRAADLKPSERVFKSLTPNPAHQMRYEVTDLLAHDTGANSDGSRGCTTVKGFTAKISPYFEVGDKFIYILVSEPTWQPPEQYRVPGVPV